MKSLKKLGKIVLVVVLVAAYLNIGWALGTYYHHNIIGYEPQTFIQKVLSGGWEFFSTCNQNPLPVSQILFGMLGWPFLLFLSLGSWLIYFVYYFLWLVFAGGIAKLLGIG